MQYRVVLDGGANIAVIPADEQPDRDMRVWTYNTNTQTWGMNVHIQILLVHANGWTEPTEPTFIDIPTEPHGRIHPAFPNGIEGELNREP